MSGAAHILARAAAGNSFAETSPAVRAAYRNFILDTFAVMAAGAAHPSLAPARKAFVNSGGSGPCSAVGFAEGCPAAIAALVNGAAMTVLQLQDGHRRARGHPMSYVLPAALAIAEESGASVPAFLDAVMAGYEVVARVGAALGGMQPLLHDTGTFGCIGAGVAAAHLLARDAGAVGRAQLIEDAIGNAASVALFPFRDTCMEGAGVHHLFVGLGAQNGVQAARAASAGLSPSKETLERFFGPRVGEAFDPALLGAGIDPDDAWSRHEIEAAYLKWHPVCAHLGPMLDCIEVLRERLGGFDAGRIGQVRIAIYPTALQYDCPTPETDLAARFSFRHVAALSLIGGPLQHDSFAPERLLMPEVSELAARVVLEADPRLAALYPENRPTRVTLTMQNGQEEEAEILLPKGDGDRALTREEVDHKAEVLMASAWGPGKNEEIRALVDTVEGSPLHDLPLQLGLALRRRFVSR